MQTENRKSKVLFKITLGTLNQDLNQMFKMNNFTNKTYQPNISLNRFEAKQNVQINQPYKRQKRMEKPSKIEQIQSQSLLSIQQGKKNIQRIYQQKKQQTKSLVKKQNASLYGETSKKKRKELKAEQIQRQNQYDIYFQQNKALIKLQANRSKDIFINKHKENRLFFKQQPIFYDSEQSSSQQDFEYLLEAAKSKYRLEKEEKNDLDQDSPNKKYQMTNPKRLNYFTFNQIKDEQFIKGQRSDSDQSSEKPKNSKEQQKMRSQRNRRISVYIKRILRAGKPNTKLTIRLILVSVIRNYDLQLKLISDPDLRIKRFECLRRRIYQCLSVLSSVGIISREQKHIIKIQQAQQRDQIEKKIDRRNKKLQRQNKLDQVSLGLGFKKQVRDDLITRKGVLQNLIYNNQKSQQRIQSKKIHLTNPLVFLVVNRQNNKIKLCFKKSRPELLKCDMINLKGKNFMRIHWIKFFKCLEKALQPKKHNPALGYTSFLNKKLHSQEQQKLLAKGNSHNCKQININQKAVLHKILENSFDSNLSSSERQQSDVCSVSQKEKSVPDLYQEDDSEPKMMN